MLIGITFAGCEFPGCEDLPDRELDYGEGEGLDVQSITYGIYQLFAASGYRVEVGPVVEKPYFSEPARGLKVNGSPVFFVEFDDEEGVREMVKKISPDGSKIGDQPLNEQGTPHFYRKGKAIALYLGDKESTLKILTSVLGEQIAGGTSTKPDPTIE